MFFRALPDPSTAPLLPEPSEPIEDEYTFEDLLDFVDSPDFGDDTQDVESSIPNTPTTSITTKTFPVEGVRLIDMELVSQQLKAGCHGCSITLHLHNITRERSAGLASFLYVNCDFCPRETIIHTSRRHYIDPDNKKKWCFDIDTKAALGMIHSGTGRTQLNGFFTTINMPAMHHSFLDKRSQEAGKAIESVAESSCETVIQQERSAYLAAMGAEDIGQVVKLNSASYDFQWQKPYGFNSNTGSGSLMGRTGIMAYETRNKCCATCQTAERLSRPPRPHDCRKKLFWEFQGHGS